MSVTEIMIQQKKRIASKYVSLIQGTALIVSGKE